MNELTLTIGNKRVELTQNQRHMILVALGIVQSDDKQRRPVMRVRADLPATTGEIATRALAGIRGGARW